MEDPYSVNSPRRSLSFSENRRGTSSFLYRDDKVSAFGFSGEHLPKPLEVYGFVGSISTVVTTAMVWAFAPENWLHPFGIFYLPSRYWALAVPAYLMVTVVLTIGFYIGLNLMASLPPTSFSTMQDEFSREPLNIASSRDDDEQPIEPLSDIGIDKINDIMFSNFN